MLKTIKALGLGIALATTTASGALANDVDETVTSSTESAEVKKLSCFLIPVG